jgi:hypothetical protein
LYSVFYDKKNETAHVGIDYPLDDINDAIFEKAVGSNKNDLITSMELLNIIDEDEKFPQKLDYLIKTNTNFYENIPIPNNYSNSFNLLRPIHPNRERFARKSQQTSPYRKVCNRTSRKYTVIFRRI